MSIHVPYSSRLALSPVTLQAAPVFPSPHSTRLAAIAEARRIQFARYMGHRALGRGVRRSYLLSVS